MTTIKSKNDNQQVVGKNVNQASNQTGQTSGQPNSALVNSYTDAQSQSQSFTSQAVSSGTRSSTQGAKTVIGVFDSRDDAEKAVGVLRSQGFTTEEINIVSKDKQHSQGREGGEFFEDDVTDGALTGGTLGGIGGLLLGAGALAIPGVGPIIAAGPIAAALSGAVAGGIAGGLIDWGIPAEAGKRYEQHVAEGGILAVIRSDSAKVNQAAQVLRQNGAKDVETHAIQ